MKTSIKNFLLVTISNAVLTGIFFILFTLCSCEEHEDLLDHSISHRVVVGDILLEDSRIVSTFDYDSLKQKAAGVVFYVNKDTAWVVCTKELGYYAYADSMVTIGNVEGDSYAMCGTENTAALLLNG